MIRVTVELDHGGLGQRVEKLAEVRISNRTGTGKKRIATYSVNVFGKGGRRLVERDALVVGHRRLANPVLNLVRKALEEAGY